MEHLTLRGMCGLLTIWSRFWPKNRLDGGYLIRFDRISGPHGGDFDQKFFWKVKCPTYARGSPSGLRSEFHFQFQRFGLRFFVTCSRFEPVIECEYSKGINPIYKHTFCPHPKFQSYSHSFFFVILSPRGTNPSYYIRLGFHYVPAAC